MRMSLLGLLAGVILAPTIAGARDFSQFALENTTCYDRDREPSTFVVDSHIHFQPFGGPAVPFDTMLDYLSREQVYFVNVYGIGQKLPAKSSCSYYLNCPGTPVSPSMTNDFVNAANVAKRLPDKLPKNLHITLSMSFTNLAEPEGIVERIHLLDEEFPGLFGWMGEINMVKQAIFPNGHYATPRAEIAKWKDFMYMLKERNIPVSFHSDLGSDREPTKYMDLMETILDTYPGNIIIWHHLGLSAELVKMNPRTHIRILEKFLTRYPNLYLDISWRVLYDNYFKQPESRERYVAFFNKYAKRIIPGTDYVASADKDKDRYHEEVVVNSDILKDLNDEAFRYIALGQNYFNILSLPYKAPEICRAE